MLEPLFPAPKARKGVAGLSGNEGSLDDFGTSRRCLLIVLATSPKSPCSLVSNSPLKKPPPAMH